MLQQKYRDGWGGVPNDQNSPAQAQRLKEQPWTSSSKGSPGDEHATYSQRTNGQIFMFTINVQMEIINLLQRSRKGCRCKQESRVLMGCARNKGMRSYGPTAPVGVARTAMTRSTCGPCSTCCSLADMWQHMTELCVLWYNHEIWHTLRFHHYKIFGYRAILDFAFEGVGGHFSRWPP